MRSSFLILAVAAALAASGCDGDTPNAPSPSAPSFSGTWTGEIVVQAVPVPAQMTWTLTQTGSSVNGPALVTLSTGTVLLNGTVAGTVNGSTLVYTLTVNAGGIPSQPACTGQLGGSATLGGNSATRTLSGSYSVVASSCPSPLTTGTFTLTRQS